MTDYIEKIIAEYPATDRHKYMMLGRMQADCEYYLGWGYRNPEKLWAGGVKEHIENMKALWNSFPPDAKPEWLTMEQIQEYEKEMTKIMLTGTCINGMKCVYDLPADVETPEQFESLIHGYNNGRMAESQREELYNQPLLIGMNGPMFNGYGTLQSTGEKVAIIRYEKPSRF